MRNVREVLREKRHAMVRVRAEVQALRLVTTLLADEADGGWNNSVQPAETGEEIVALPLAHETESVPGKIPAHGTWAAASNVKFARAKKISRHLRRIAEPLLGTWATRGA